MTTKHLFRDEPADILLMTPRRGGADFDDEGTGSSSGYGDMNEEDDFLDEDDIDDELHDDELEDDELDEEEIEDDVDDDSTLY